MRNKKQDLHRRSTMKNGKNPDPNVNHPIAGYDKEIYVKPTITNQNIIVGDFTCIADFQLNHSPCGKEHAMRGRQPEQRL
jgi:virginiamycin A acetyltransferase